MARWDDGPGGSELRIVDCKKQNDGEVTATMKVQRKSINGKYAEVIEALYA